MTILVHDGSEGSEYNSYASLAAANEYHALRATPGWDTATNKEAALVRATDYIDTTYKLTPVVEGAVHHLVVKATIVMAAYALTDTLTAKANREVVEEEKELTGVSKKKVKYSEAKITDPYPMVTKILAPLTGQGSASITTGKITK